MPEKLEYDKVKLHISCGTNYFDGWININNNIDNNIPKLDLIWDFTSPLQFEPKTVDIIYDENFFENLAFYQSLNPNPLAVYSNLLKPNGVFKVVFPHLNFHDELKSQLKMLGINNVVFYNTKQELNNENIVKEIIEDDIVVIDGTFPQAEPLGFRNMEINELFKEIPNLNNYTMHPIFPGQDAWFRHSYGVTEEIFNRNKEGYLKVYPQNEKKLKYLYPNKKYNFKLAYSYFLAETYTLLPFYEANDIPFIFTLYPGGGFGLNNPSSDAMLRKIFNSKCFRKVIATQNITLQYLIEKNLCPKEKIEYLFCGYLQFQKNEIPEKKFYLKDKTTIDLCFVAAKYSQNGIDKGYDLFIDTAKSLCQKYPHLRFHVIGGFDEKEIDISEIKDKITFYGYKTPAFLKNFYPSMDICIAPHRLYKLYEGNFDGFPQGFDSLCFDTLLMTCDELNNNEGFIEGEEIVIIKPELNNILEKIIPLLENTDILYKIGKNGKEKVFEILNPEIRIKQVTNLLKQEAKNAKLKIMSKEKDKEELSYK